MVPSSADVADLVFFYGTLMAGFDRRRRAGIDDKLTYVGRGAISGGALRRRAVPRRGAGAGRVVWGEVYAMTEPATVLAALDEIEGYSAGDPDRSLYLRQRTDGAVAGRELSRGERVLLQRAARSRAAHHVRGLSGARAGTVRLPTVVTKDTADGLSRRARSHEITKKPMSLRELRDLWISR